MSKNGKQPDGTTNRLKGPGGSPGGMGMFVFGLALTVAGGYLILKHTQIGSGYWSWWGTNTFGLTLLPLIIGIGLLFFDGRSIAGWVLAGAGTLIIFVGIIVNLQIHFPQTSLFNVIVMLTLFAGGLGLIARSLKSY
ncbi:MAG TPA: hypothetical protein VLU47_02750 [Blastocatellia bacterium]|nr:hypothetical protein [Blastocatellia bacterium]